MVGHVPRCESLTLPERHLGLVPTVEGPVDYEFLDLLVAQCEETMDIPSIINIAGQAASPAVENRLFPPEKKPSAARIAVARDMAFSEESIQYKKYSHTEGKCGNENPEQRQNSKWKRCIIYNEIKCQL